MNPLNRHCAIAITLLFLLPCKASALIEVTSVSHIYNGCSGAINITATGTAGPFTFEWTGPSGFTDTTEDLTNLCEAGIYTVKVKFPGTDCFATLTAQVTQCGEMDVSSILYPLCNPTANDGAIDITVSGGLEPYDFTWTSTGNNLDLPHTEDLQDLEAGLYWLEITDAEGCHWSPPGPFDHLFELTVSTSVSYNFTADPESPACTSGVLSVEIFSGRPPFNISWSTGETNTTSITVGATGNYAVTVTDGCGSVQAADPILYEVSPAMTLDIQSLCGIDVIDLTVVGGSSPYTYVWSWSQGNQTWNNEDLYILNYPVSGTYTVLVTDGFFCTASASINPLPKLEFSGIQTNASFNQCMDGSINLNVSGGTLPYDFEWTGPLGFNSSSEDVTGLMPGNYCVTISDSRGCSLFKCYNIISNTTVGIAKITNIPYCDNNQHTGGAIDLSQIGNTPLQYAWSGPNGYQSSDKNISGLKPGFYSVTISGPNGCTQVLSATICCCTSLGGTNELSCSGNSSYPPPPLTELNLYSMIAPPDAQTNTGSLSVLALNGSTPSPGHIYYTWSGPNGYQGFSSTITGLYVGMYCVTATNGCSSISDCFEIEPCATLSAIITGRENCPGFSAGKVLLSNISGGNAPYYYVWSNGIEGANSTQIEHLSTGVYTVTIYDSGGCTISQTASVGIMEPVSYYESGKDYCRKVYRCQDDIQIDNQVPIEIFIGCNRVALWCEQTQRIMSTTNYPIGSQPPPTIQFNSETCELYCQRSSSPTHIGVKKEFYLKTYHENSNLCIYESSCVFENITINGEFKQTHVIPYYSFHEAGRIDFYYECAEGENFCYREFYCRDSLVREAGCKNCNEHARPAGQIIVEGDEISGKGQINDNSPLIHYLFLLASKFGDADNFGVLADVDLTITVSDYFELFSKKELPSIRFISRDEIFDQLELLRDFKIKITPNPFEDVLSVKLENITKDGMESNILIVNAIGAVLFDKTINSNNLEVNTSGFPAGIYFLHVKTSFKSSSFVLVKK